MTTSVPSSTTPHSLLIPYRRESTNAGHDPDILIVWGAIVIGAIFVIAWIFKRGAGRQSGANFFGRFKIIQRKRSVEIHGRVQLTPHTSLHVVHWHGEEILLGCSMQSITILGRQPASAKNGSSGDCIATVIDGRKNDK
jgi:flagellar biogenesis protein FliO